MYRNKLSEFVKICGKLKHDLLFAIIFLNDDAGNTYAAAGLDSIKLGAVIAVLEELLEGQHAAGDIDISKLDVSLGKSLFHRGASGSMHAGVHNNLFHFNFSFDLENRFINHYLFGFIIDPKSPYCNIVL